MVDCPTEEYINSMVENNVFEKFQSRAIKDEDMAYIIAHFTPAKVMQNARYLNNCIHIFAFKNSHKLLSTEEINSS